MENRQLYVRKCYPNLFTVIYGSVKRKHVVTGTPGIGKSFSFYYLLMRLLHSPSPPPYILWEHHTRPDIVWCYTHETGEVWVGNNIAFRRQFHNRDSCVLEGLGAVCCGNVIPVDRACVWSLFFGWLLIPWTSPEEVSCHGVKPDTSTAAHTVLLTSPVHETMKVIVKEGADVLYMPLWELEELLDCRSKMYDMVPEVTVKGLFGYYGGMARYVLQHPSLDPDREVLELLRPLRTAIDTCNVKQVRMAIGAVERVPEASHRLVHIVADDEFKKQHLRFASSWAADEFVKRALEIEKKKVISLLKMCDGGLKGLLYEPVMHAVLAAGGKFDVVPLDRETLERGNEEKLDIQPCKETSWFKDNISSVSSVENVYYRPMASNFSVIDAVKMPEVYLFQITVSESKEINAADLEKKLAQLGIPDNPKPSLFFVVSPDVYNTFKVRAATKKRKAGEDGEAAWPPGTGEKYPRSGNTRLYILCGNYEDLRCST
ncbi:hypothetical protein VOLCADRAFT_108555 [Volvox carteri f. nagariensis]|uniref:Crinkler (CRN) family protein n=1 Tax=Volvox carteri f. nagariensis TaxID=3068 RepID=D8UKX4_VOLCA|nr:uncharacterized protein VOLCADRAFT_108555 [Volvox carteri f. nagariensis]EFJ39626.1 hypothetical protein VOLCADRAFT_108555 [Volvox carteri f. nagariensis]|eukprot:XP_002959310.1 hypothetical protein VOLCADRAFT_108555 [Volvox carteri f. nagariensis]